MHRPLVVTYTKRGAIGCWEDCNVWVIAESCPLASPEWIHVHLENATPLAPLL